MSVTPDAIRKLLDELEANRQSRKSAWATLQRLRKLLETTGARISISEERTFETEGEAIESGLRRTIAGRDAVMRSLIRAVYRFRDATLVADKKDDFGVSVSQSPPVLLTAFLLDVSMMEIGELPKRKR
jgi:hypothetical protein